jgi:hypothetical protein
VDCIKDMREVAERTGGLMRTVITVSNAAVASRHLDHAGNVRIGAVG